MVLPVEVAAQLAGLDGVISDALSRLELVGLHALFGADVMHLVALFQQMGQQRKVRGDVAHRAAAGEDDLLTHMVIPAFQVDCLLHSL